MTKSYFIKQRIVFLFVSASIALASNTSEGKPIDLEDISEAEMRLLPRYCADTQGFKYGYKESPNYQRWEQMMGQTFWHLYHYCWSLLYMNRSNRAGIPNSKRQSQRELALGSYQYVIDNSPEDFVLLPEIYTKKGEVELLLKKISKANQSFSHARKLKPDYWPAYSHWAEYLISIGHKNDAFAIVKSGLRFSPRAKVLLEQYRLLGGKTSDIPTPSETSSPSE